MIPPRVVGVALLEPQTGERQLPRAILVPQRLLDAAQGHVRCLEVGPGRPGALVLVPRVLEMIVALGEPAQEQVCEIANAHRPVRRRRLRRARIWRDRPP